MTILRISNLSVSNDLYNAFIKDDGWIIFLGTMGFFLGIIFLINKINANKTVNSGQQLKTIISSLKYRKDVSCASIVQECGNPINIVHSKDDNGEPITEKTWLWGNYEVVLTFDSNDILLGIKSETWY